MKVTGKIELFKNERGYVTGVIKSFSEEKKVNGKCFLDVKGVDVEEGETLTIDMTEAYLNCVHVDTKESGFDKLAISVKQYEIVKSHKARK